MVIMLLVAAITAAVIYAVITVVEDAERKTLADRLARGERALVELLRYRQDAVRSDCHIMANEPQLRAVVDTDTNRETIVDVIADLKKGLANDLFLVADEQGKLLSADTTGDDATAAVTIKRALETGDGDGVWIVKDRPYQVHACRMAFQDHVVGIAIVGRVIKDELVAAVQGQTGSTAFITIDRKPVAVSPLTDDWERRRARSIRSARRCSSSRPRCSSARTPTWPSSGHCRGTPARARCRTC